MDKVQTLNSFWNSFSLKAYDENTVPDDAKLPYITYEVRTDSFGNAVAHSASIWYRDTGWLAITQKEMEISQRIGRGGVIVDYDGGALWIKKSSPWSNRMEDPSDDMIRRIVLNLNIEYID